jgi:hypothetical protein
MHALRKHAFHSYGNAAVLMSILVTTAVQQGCLAAAWVAAVGTDSLRAGDVRFQPFEASWVSDESAKAIVNRPALGSLAVMPVGGDDTMADRLTTLLRRETTLTVMTPVQRLSQSAVPVSDDDRATLARELSRKLGVDAVLYGHVVGPPPRVTEWGWNTQESRRLFLYMIDRHGHLLWRDELPFLVVTGGKSPLEASVQRSLTRHFMEHVHAIGLDEAGYIPVKPL